MPLFPMILYYIQGGKNPFEKPLSLTNDSCGIPEKQVLRYYSA